MYKTLIDNNSDCRHIEIQLDFSRPSRKRQVSVRTTNHSTVRPNRYFIRMNFLVQTIMLLLLLPGALFAQGQVEIPLKKVILPDTTEFPHARIVSFAIQPGDSTKFPADWSTIETGTLMNNASFQEVDIARFKADDGTRKYVVDANANGTFTDDPILKFRESGGHRFADVEVSVKRRTNGQELQKLTYRVGSDDTGATARIGECREGTLKVNGKDYWVRVVLTSANTPYFSGGKGTVALADMNRDGVQNYKWAFSPDSSIEESERMYWDKPFMLQGEGFQAKSVDPTGTHLMLDKLESDTALAIGFHAPAWTAKDMYGFPYASDSLLGKVVLLFFWATTCHYCESIRPKLDAMVARDTDKRFRLMSFTTERDTSKLKTFLRAKPYGGTIIPYDSLAWEAYNSRMLTPTYCLIDGNGVIQLYGAGASFFAYIEKKTDELLRK